MEQPGAAPGPGNPARRFWLRGATAGVLSATRWPLLPAPAASVALATSALSGCATTPANVIEPPAGFIPAPQVRSGQSWRYALINRYNGERFNEVVARVASVAPELRIELTDQDGKRLADEVYDKPWHIRQEPVYSDTLIFDDAVALLPDKLAVGARQAVRTRYKTVTGKRSYPWFVELYARRWERIVVPAGQFDTLRIERNIRFEHTDVFRHDSRRVDTLWYAPSANRWVMRDWTGYYYDDDWFPFGRGFGHWPGDNIYSRFDRPPWSGFQPGLSEEREDAIRWVLLDQQAAPVA